MPRTRGRNLVGPNFTYAVLWAAVASQSSPISQSIVVSFSLGTIAVQCPRDLCHGTLSSIANKIWLLPIKWSLLSPWATHMLVA